MLNLVGLILNDLFFWMSCLNNADHPGMGRFKIID